MSYGVFVLSHDRVDRMETIKTLEKGGYTGKIHVLVDSEDPSIDKYRDRYDTIVFDKQPYIDIADTILPERKRNTALYARNAVEGIAKEMGYDVLYMLDDDITSLRYRWIEGDSVKSLMVRGGLDKVFDIYSDFIVESGITTLSFCYSMFFVSGTHNLDDKIRRSRHTCQIHMRNTHIPIEWKSVINQDTITILLTAKVGKLWWSIPNIVYEAVPMNKESGGLKDVYDSMNDFDMAFLAVIACPSCCTIVDTTNARAKVRIKENEDACYPLVVSSRCKKW